MGYGKPPAYFKTTEHLDYSLSSLWSHSTLLQTSLVKSVPRKQSPGLSMFVLFITIANVVPGRPHIPSTHLWVRLPLCRKCPAGWHLPDSWACFSLLSCLKATKSRRQIYSSSPQSSSNGGWVVMILCSLSWSQSFLGFVSECLQQNWATVASYGFSHVPCFTFLSFVICASWGHLLIKLRSTNSLPQDLFFRKIPSNHCISRSLVSGT